MNYKCFYGSKSRTTSTSLNPQIACLQVAGWAAYFSVTTFLKLFIYISLQFFHLKGQSSAFFYIFTPDKINNTILKNRSIFPGPNKISRAIHKWFATHNFGNLWCVNVGLLHLYVKILKTITKTKRKKKSQREQKRL